jgi:hypothetical protein
MELALDPYPYLYLNSQYPALVPDSAGITPLLLLAYWTKILSRRKVVQRSGIGLEGVPYIALRQI